jgi:hypothetical protein
MTRCAFVVTKSEGRTDNFRFARDPSTIPRDGECSPVIQGFGSLRCTSRALTKSRRSCASGIDSWAQCYRLPGTQVLVIY